MDAHTAVLKVGFDERMSPGRTGLFGLQHLLALTGIWIFPILIGQQLGLAIEDVALIIQGCFLMTGIITILQSSRVLRLPVVHGPSAAFFLAIVAAGSTFGLDVAFGSMAVAAAIYMVLSIPLRRIGLFGHIARLASSPVVFGTLFVIIGAQLASVGLSGWFGVEGQPGYGATNFWVGVVTALVVVGCLVLGGDTLIRRAAIVWGIAIGSVVSAVVGVWTPSGGSQIIALPTFAPFGLGIEWTVVAVMLLAFFQAGSESAGMYQLLGSWGGQKVDVDRTNRGLFTEFLGSGIGALFGGIGTVSYPENAGIVRITQIGSRFVTLTAGGAAVVLAFFPSVALFLAGLPAAVLAAASTILFGVIAISGVQMMSTVEWDDLNIAVAAPSFIISLGSQFVPEDMVATLPPAGQAIVQNPMLLGIVMLIVLHVIVNIGVRKLLASGSKSGENDPSGGADELTARRPR